MQAPAMTKVTVARMGEQPEPGAVPERARMSERKIKAQHKVCCASSLVPTCLRCAGQRL